MKLNRLIKGLEIIKVVGNTELEIADIKINSNAVTKNSLFICISGKGFDGHGFVRQVELYGASAIITEKQLDTTLTQVIVKDSRVAMSYVAGQFYGHADRKMKLIAIVGTNGKTSTSHIIKEILDENDIKCGVIGTLGSFYLEKYIEPTLTTPDPIELHKILFEMYCAGIEVVVMEVSAHAIFLEKVNGVKFHTAVFTNFTQDHLDFFGNMETYRQAKFKFFKDNQFKYVISNSDDALGREILNIKSKTLAYGIDNPADSFAINIENKIQGVKFVINLFDCIYDVKTNMIGKFNVYNILAAASVCAIIGVKPNKIVRAVSNVNGISGRLEKVHGGEFFVYIDYAHTPDGLEKALQALRPFAKGKLISVFGCGGNRDEGKRRIMGEISAKNADFTIITSDNPRYEEPMDIINQIEQGVLSVNKKFLSIEDREDAINYALHMATKGDVVLIAGKGSERYQEILGIKKPYNDKDTVEEYFRGKTK